MKVLYFHGYGSSATTGTVDYLKQRLLEDEVFAVDIPVDAIEALPYLKKVCAEIQPDIIIGTSMGAMYAHQMPADIYKICVNPALHLSELTDIVKIGTFDLYTPRLDGTTEFTITEEIVQHYRDMEAHQFDDYNEANASKVVGLFGEKDETVNCREEFSKYYSDIRTGNFDHRLNTHTIKKYVLPIVYEIRIKL